MVDSGYLVGKGTEMVFDMESDKLRCKKADNYLPEKNKASHIRLLFSQKLYSKTCLFYRISFHRNGEHLETR
jgi:hypothetical protein